MERIITSGKRKRAIARAFLVKGDGKVTINKRDYKTLNMFDRLKLEEPLRIAQNIIGDAKFDVMINTYGGGEKGQIDAARIALAKAISEFAKSEELINAFVEYDRNLLVADVRRKETYKPGDSKARRKRQKSYR